MAEYFFFSIVRKNKFLNNFTDTVNGKFEGECKRESEFLSQY
jgi:hypothetical protein